MRVPKGGRIFVGLRQLLGITHRPSKPNQNLPTFSSSSTSRKPNAEEAQSSSRRRNLRTVVKQRDRRDMGVTKEQVESSLTSKMNPSHVEVTDTSGGCGASFVIEIVSSQFEGKRLLERHRMVNAALEEEMKQIHALSIRKALTPEQWKQQQESENPKPAAS